MKWTKEYIMQRVEEHYQDALKLFPSEQIVGIFLQGSQNYGVAYEDSDVDTKMFIIPSIDDLCMGKSPISTVYIRENNEHIDIKDIRYLTELITKENLSYLELLFTDYCIINPLYEPIFQKLKDIRDNIPFANFNRFLRALKGMAHEKMHAMEHKYPSKIDIIEKFGYDPKQLHHLIRLRLLLNNFLKTKTLSKCYLVDPKNADYLILIKRGFYTLDEARKLGKEVLNEIDNTVNEQIDSIEDKCDFELINLVKKVQSDIMKSYIFYTIKKGEE